MIGEGSQLNEIKIIFLVHYLFFFSIRSNDSFPNKLFFIDTIRTTIHRISALALKKYHVHLDSCFSKIQLPLHTYFPFEQALLPLQRPFVRFGGKNTDFWISYD